ncbi:hypothetical protein EON65_39085 [archaeon]|nr:MAG: hypothetical protein EON65_39085 [archaeon]
MEVNDQTLGVLRDLLINALSHDNNTRKNAENYIKTQEMQTGFPVLVLTLIQRLIHVPNPSPQDMAIRQSAAVLFKNIVKKHWSSDEDDDNASKLISLSDKEVIKAHLVELMTTSTPDVQKQLAEAVSLVAKHDFPEHWQNLLPQLINKLEAEDITIKKGVMLTANSIMKRFRYVYKSDDLYRELLTCLAYLQEPLLKHFQQNFVLIQQFASNKASLLVLFETQRLICRVFFSLNWQDIPEYFEDHIAEWMTEFARYLNYTNPLLVDADNEDEPGPIELLQAAIIENISFYVNR